LITAGIDSRLKRSSLPGPFDSLLDLLLRIRLSVHELRRTCNCVRAPGQCSIRLSHRPAKLKVVQEAMRQIDRSVLPKLRDGGDAIAFILPTAIEWVGWESMKILDTEEEFSEHVRDLAHAGLDGALLMLLGMLGPHLRQQSDEIDRRMIPLLMGIALRQFRQSLDCEDMVAAQRLAAIIFSALHFNPDYSLARDRVRQRAPYNFETYRNWFTACVDEIRSAHPLLDAPGLLQRSIELFPSLLGAPGDPLPLPLQFADKSRGYMEQSGQDLLELLAQQFERREYRTGTYCCPTVWEFVSCGLHPVVQDFMRRRNHRIPPFQLALLLQIRDSLVRRTLWG
jgi:hypothetical protein